MIVKQQHQLIGFSLATGVIQLQLVAELTLEYGWFEGGAEREGDAGNPFFGSGYPRLCLEGAERNERRRLDCVRILRQVRRVAGLDPIIA